MEKKIFLGSLDGFYHHIKKEAKTGGDLYLSFKKYHDLVLTNWPDNMADNGNWISEMKSVLSGIETKRKVIHLSSNSTLKSFRDDAVDVIHEINSKFMMHLKES